MVGLILPLAGSLAPIASGGAPAGIASVDTVVDLAGLTASPGDQRYVEEEGEVRTLIDCGPFNVWMRDRHCRKADGTLYDAALGLDDNANPLHVYGGMTIPGTWPSIGTQTVNADHVVLNGVVYPNSAVTASRYVLWLEMHEAPPVSSSGTGLSGLIGASTVGGTVRITGTRFTNGGANPVPVDIGHYSASQTQAGAATYQAGYPLECLVDLSSADAVSEVVCGRGPGAVTKRSSMLTGTGFWEVGALTSGGTAINGFKVKRAALITLT